jgi:hypothetical protein
VCELEGENRVEFIVLQKDIFLIILALGYAPLKFLLEIGCAKNFGRATSL